MQIYIYIYTLDLISCFVWSRAEQERAKTRFARVWRREAVGLLISYLQIKGNTQTEHNNNLFHSHFPSTSYRIIILLSSAAIIITYSYRLTLYFSCRKKVVLVPSFISLASFFWSNSLTASVFHPLEVRLSLYVESWKRVYYLF